jgi:hypothetical protein
MKTNISLIAAQVETARIPSLGKDLEVYFADEICTVRGTVTATAAAVGAYVSAGGAAIPTGGRDLCARIKNPSALGSGGAMAITLNVVLEDDTVDTAVATFDIPTYTDAVNLNRFPMGTTSDFVPTTVANAAKQVKSITSLASVANMTPGNEFEICTTPDLSQFTHISCIEGADGKFNMPEVIEIACGGNASEFTRLGMVKSNPLSIKFKDRGALEQLNRFNGCRGTVRMDLKKDGSVLAAYFLYSGYYVMANTERGTGDDVDMATSEGPYQRFFIGYARVPA